jgi:dTMP kinase
MSLESNKEAQKRSFGSGDMKGKFIVIEGPNKAGKTTQSNLLKKFLEKQGFSVFYAKHPEDKNIGKIIRDKLIKSKEFSPQTTAITFAASAMFENDSSIKKARNEYDYIVMDRYYHSTFTYQILSGCKFEWIKELYRYLIKPDLVFILNIPIEEFKKRKQKNEDIFEKDQEFQKKLRKAYLDLPQKLNEDFVIIDGTKSKESIHKKIREIVVKL